MATQVTSSTQKYAIGIRAEQELKLQGTTYISTIGDEIWAGGMYGDVQVCVSIAS